MDNIVESWRVINHAETRIFSFIKRLLINVLWLSDVDFAPCLFWKKEDGTTGGVFEPSFTGNKHSLGRLFEFPFIQLVGDQKTDLPDSIESFIVTNIDELTELYIVVIHYDAAYDQKDVTFNEHDARVEIKTDTGECFKIFLDSSDAGNVYNVCKIKNTGTQNKIINIGDVLTVAEAFYQIPGFESICEKNFK